MAATRKANPMGVPSGPKPTARPGDLQPSSPGAQPEEPSEYGNVVKCRSLSVDREPLHTRHKAGGIRLGGGLGSAL